MRWEDYREAYHGFLLSVCQTMVLNLVAGEVLKDFPKGLPGDLREPLIRVLKETARALQDVLSGVEGGRIEGIAPALDANLSRAEVDIEAELERGTTEATPTESREVEIAENLFVYVLFMHVALSLSGVSSLDVDFNRLLCSQQLVMVLAHLDAFLADSLRAICWVRPEVLRSEKKVEWDTILSCREWDELLAHLVEQYVFEFGWQSIHKRLQFLEKRLGLVIDYPEADLELLGSVDIVVFIGGRRIGRPPHRPFCRGEPMCSSDCMRIWDA